MPETRTIDELVHDAEHADGGASMAASMGDAAAFKEYQTKRNALLRQALSLDPEMSDDAWTWCDPEVRKLARTLQDIAAARTEGES